MTRFTFLDATGAEIQDAAAAAVVRDALTKLEWAATPFLVQSQQEGVDKAAALELLGSGWRLPTRTELFALVDDTRCRPATFADAFPNTPTDDWYWTSTPAAYSPADDAWVVFFSDGSAGWGSRDSSGFVRAVREAA